MMWGASERWTPCPGLHYRLPSRRGVDGGFLAHVRRPLQLNATLGRRAEEGLIADRRRSPCRRTPAISLPSVAVTQMLKQLSSEALCEQLTLLSLPDAARCPLHPSRLLPSEASASVLKQTQGKTLDVGCGAAARQRDKTHAVERAS